MSQPGENDLDAAAAELASELSAIRQRGISGIDRRRSRDGKQQPLVLPMFERLLEQFHAPAGTSRQAQIEALLRAELDAYEQAAPADDAAFIRRLLFSPDGSVPLGPGSQGELLDKARAAAGLKGKADAFRAIQNERFDLFAAFLLQNASWVRQPTAPSAKLDTTIDGYQEAAGNDVPPQQSTVLSEEELSNQPPEEVVPAPAGRHPRRMAWLVAAVVVAAIAGAAVLVSAHLQSHSSGDSGTPAGSPSTSKPASYQFRFDSLGSRASSILNVYPGVGQTAHDKQANGTFHSGDVVTAVCVTTGRQIKSDPSYGETARSSTQWVRIAAVEGVTQYATLTYGEYVGSPPPSC